YATMRLDGARIAFSSTNGTVSIVKSLDNNRVAAGAFSNISALCRWILQKDDDIIVVCSGWKGDPSLEDTLFAGALACKLGNHVIAVNDAANMAIDLYRLAQNDVEGYCQKASHVRRLLGLNYDNDVHFAFQEDTCGLVPTWDKATCALHVEKP
ncbi:MAG: 2-phosphosulfolactate phosphatase, partial [Bacteroidales bacterium]|nr:2-phosphosulfolactate phosphatase [Bacteroidales bacterium]